MSKILNLLRQIGCANAKSDGIYNISDLRDKRWVKMFAEQGYTKGELIFPDGGHSSFFLVLPDGNVASADNVMCANGFYAIANELQFDADDVLGEEPYGEFIMYTDEDGIEFEDCTISIWTPQEFMTKLKMCKQLAGNNINESKNINNQNVVRLTESELKNIITESVKQIMENLTATQMRNMLDINDDEELNAAVDTEAKEDLLSNICQTLTNGKSIYKTDITFEEIKDVLEDFGFKLIEINDDNECYIFDNEKYEIVIYPTMFYERPNIMRIQNIQIF